MDSWWWLLRWCTSEMIWYVGFAVVICQYLVPWTLWLGRRIACWCRCALSHSHCAAMSRPWTPTCPCCDGVDFDGMEGRWAVVTGCTDGIGKEYALQLADRRINVALVSRNADKLRAVANEIDKRHAGAVRTRVVVADFTSSGGTVPLDRTYDAVRRSLADLDVAVLINNAGLSYERPNLLLDLPPCCSGTPTGGDRDLCRDIIECNVLATVVMCRIAMPLMVTAVHDTVATDGRQDSDRLDVGDEQQPLLQQSPPPTNRGRGGVIINVSSVTAQLTCPLLAVYSSTKAFVEKFSNDLAAEYDSGAHVNYGMEQTPRIAVRCLLPGFVSTKMSRMRPSMYVPGATAYVRHSLLSLGCHCGCRVARGWPERRRSDGTGQHGDGVGWLASASAAVFDSPSSPFSVGCPGVGTTGYTLHTVMVMATNAMKWTIGEAYLSRAVSRIMYQLRDRKYAKAARDAAKAVPEQRNR